jgi:hypothetical protein
MIDSGPAPVRKSLENFRHLPCITDASALHAVPRTVPPLISNSRRQCDAHPRRPVTDGLEPTVPFHVLNQWQPFRPVRAHHHHRGAQAIIVLRFAHPMTSSISWKKSHGSLSAERRRSRRRSLRCRYESKRHRTWWNRSESVKEIWEKVRRCPGSLPLALSADISRSRSHRLRLAFGLSPLPLVAAASDGVVGGEFRCLQ